MTIWLTGGSGLLGGWVSRHLRGELARDVFADRVELTDAEAVERAFDRLRPEAIVHAAALAAIPDCARDPERARVLNVDVTARIARLAAKHGSRLVHVSTDLVFDGESAPYAEGATRAPTSVYGRTKAEAEDAILAAGGNAVVARVSLLYGPTCAARRSFFDAMVDALRAGAPLRLFEDEWRTPLSLRRAAEALGLLAGSKVTGIIHVGGPERMSRLEMGRRLATLLGTGDAHIEPSSRLSVPGEPRPRDVSLDSSAFRKALGHALGRYGERDDFETECRAMRVATEGRSA